MVVPSSGRPASWWALITAISCRLGGLCRVGWCATGAHLPARRAFLPCFCLVVLITNWMLCPSHHMEQHRLGSPGLPSNSNVIVTLATTAQRAQHELPLALASLLHQTHRPHRIWVFAPLGEEVAFASLVPLLAAQPSIELRHLPDLGPATKFLYALKRLQALERGACGGGARTGASINGAPCILPPPPRLLVVDDDHVYAPRLVATLLAAAHVLPSHAAAGLRGWRVRRDLVRARGGSRRACGGGCPEQPQHPSWLASFPRCSHPACRCAADIL